MIRTTTVRQVVSYTPVADELNSRVEALNEQGCHITNIIETRVNMIPGCSDQGFIIVYDDSVKPMYCGKILQQVMILRKFVKTHMNDFDSGSDAHRVLKDISVKLKTIINGGM